MKIGVELGSVIGVGKGGSAAGRVAGTGLHAPIRNISVINVKTLWYMNELLMQD